MRLSQQHHQGFCAATLHTSTVGNVKIGRSERSYYCYIYVSTFRIVETEVRVLENLCYTFLAMAKIRLSGNEIRTWLLLQINRLNGKKNEAHNPAGCPEITRAINDGFPRFSGHALELTACGIPQKCFICIIRWIASLFISIILFSFFIIFLCKCFSINVNYMYYLSTAITLFDM